MKSVARITNGYQQCFKEHLHSVEKFCSDFSDLYAKEYYPKIEHLIVENLEDNDALISPSQEIKLQCIQHGFSEELYTSLVQTITVHLTEYSQCLFDQLTSLKEDSRKACVHIKQFHNKLKNFGKFVQTMSPMFKPLNSAYVQPQLNSTMEEKLLELFKKLYVETHAPSVLQCMLVVRKTPFLLSPSQMYEVANAIYAMQPVLRPVFEDLFSVYIPNVRTPLKLENLEAEKELIKTMQITIQKEIDELQLTSVKRSNDDVQIEDEECPNSMLSSLLMGLGT